MKFIISGPGGLLENATDLVGYERLCFMVFEEKELAKKVFDNVGKRLLTYYKTVANIDPVGACIVNDDWGFKTQTLLPHEILREMVFPWHEKIVETIHQSGKKAILHSCGNLNDIMDEIIDNLHYDAKHSFEDLIIPVEEAWKRWGDRIAILGGIDMNLLANGQPAEILSRAQSLLKLTACKGYALGSGNSIPEYVPVENYMAMISVANVASSI